MELNLASEIHNNLDEIIQDKEKALFYFQKISSHDDLIKECLKYDLINYSPEENKKTNNIDSIIDICKDILNKTQYVVEGFSIEDKDWIYCETSNHRFHLKKNQRILYNTIEKKNCDKNLIEYLNNILTYTQKFINGNEIKIKYNIIEDEKNCICWIIYTFYCLQ